METTATPLTLNVSGRFVIKDVTDPDNPILLADEPNAVHIGNMAKHIAFAMAGADNHAIHSMIFGLGSGAASGRTPDVDRAPSRESAISAPRYGAVVNRVNDAEYSVFAREFADNYADIVTTCTIPANEYDENFDYDEVGILSLDPSNPELVYQDVTFNGAEISVPRGILLVHKILAEKITKMHDAAHQVSHTLRIRI